MLPSGFSFDGNMNCAAGPVPRSKLPFDFLKGNFYCEGGGPPSWSEHVPDRFGNMFDYGTKGAKLLAFAL